ncbi:MAG TPA: flavin reductase family protein, partial [Elusimicrobiales bacterium]|nr:flavin reductase family protein [Elusimicrobiales bacterium]
MLDKDTLTALFDVSYGLYIVSSHDGDKLNGQLTNTVFQVTAEPPRMAAAINKNNLTHDYISKSGCFTISTLAQDAPMPFIGLFGFKSGRAVNKFEKVRHELCPCGSPI